MTATLHHTFARSAFQPLGDREIVVRASDENVGRDGLILLTPGCRLDNFRKAPIALLNHDMKTPLGMVPDIGPVGSEIIATIRYAPEGVSEVADTAYKMTIARVYNAVSVGFDIISVDPPKNGVRIVREWELLELSVVGIPALVSAQILQRTRSLSDRSQVLLEAARDHLSEARQHSDTIRDCVARGTLTAAESPHLRMFPHLRSAAAMLDETADRNPPPGRRLTDARRHVRGAITAHRNLADSLDEASISRCRSAHGDLDRCLRNASGAVDDLLSRPTVPDDGSLGPLADFSKEGTSATLADKMDPNSVTTAHAHLPLSVRVASAAHMHQLAVSGCASMIPRATAGDVDAALSYEQRQRDKALIGNKSWNPAAKRAALNKLFK